MLDLLALVVGLQFSNHYAQQNEEAVSAAWNM